MKDSHKSNWHQKTVIITGGSSGIGKATALALANMDAHVLITGRRQEKLEEVASANKNIQYVVADTSDSNSAEKIVHHAVSAFDRIDTLINNAGAGGLRPIEDYSAEFISDICAANIIGPSLLLKEALPLLKESKGTVINICTAVSKNAGPVIAHYGATKAALEYLTRSWAIELAPHGIRVNGIAPGPVKTGALTGMMGLNADMAKSIEEIEASQVPLGRRGITDDIVPWILKFAHADNHWTTGQILSVDGGWSQRSHQ
ncbi:SDR family NAD(P)-dependent oxidoreductase [Kiloniella majae]|uniref:SDR family NAD(P)-dependent oxidoreductase n=1 Tax=Kiloniella majae TaxID=1938558 RepID=UPI000A27910A|nr:SDR family oxidoreductase [Kiloniella majae]